MRLDVTKRRINNAFAFGVQNEASGFFSKMVNAASEIFDTCCGFFTVSTDEVINRSGDWAGCFLGLGVFHTKAVNNFIICTDN